MEVHLHEPDPKPPAAGPEQRIALTAGNNLLTHLAIFPAGAAIGWRNGA
jgi:hypothetical protein